MSGPAMLAVDGMPVVISKWVPAYAARHPSVQRWWPRVLKHLGEAEGGEPKLFVVGGAIHIHPDVFDKVAVAVARWPL